MSTLDRQRKLRVPAGARGGIRVRVQGASELQGGGRLEQETVSVLFEAQSVEWFYLALVRVATPWPSVGPQAFGQGREQGTAVGRVGAVEERKPSTRAEAGAGKGTRGSSRKHPSIKGASSSAHPEQKGPKRA